METLKELENRLYERAGELEAESERMYERRDMAGSQALRLQAQTIEIIADEIRAMLDEREANGVEG